jgi:hypothetical protein
LETVIEGSTLDALRAGLRGAAYAPGDEGYDEARQAWNLNAHQSIQRSSLWQPVRRTLSLRCAWPARGGLA